MNYYEIGGIGFGFDVPGVCAESDFYGSFSIGAGRFGSLADRHFFECGDFGFSLSGTEKPVAGEEGNYIYPYCGGFLKVTDRFDGKSYRCLCLQSEAAPGGKITVTGCGPDARKTSAELFRITDFSSSLLFYDAFILHASVVRTGERALLFSGDSGIGKSTQARLWHEYRGAEILNGDRVLIRRKDGKWLASGLPLCGSSGICVNFSLPVGAVVFLSKAKNNSVRTVSGTEAFVSFFSGVTNGARSIDSTKKFADLVADAAEALNTVSFACTPDESAVDYLDSYLNLL